MGIYHEELTADATERVLCHYGPESPWAQHAGLRLQTLRRASGMSTGAFLERTGLSKSRLSRYETGKVLPSMGEMIMIAHVFELEVEDIWRIPRWPDVAQAAFPKVAA